MLKSLRNKKLQKRLLILITLLILPGFLIWGSMSFVRNKQEGAIMGYIAGKKVSFSEYRDALQAVKNQAIMQYGDKIEEAQKELNLDDLTWKRLILLEEAKRRGIPTNDRQVIELIESYAFFQRQGQFDNVIYNQMLQYVFRTQPRVFEEQIRQNLILYKLYKSITDTIKFNDEEVKEEYKKAASSLSISYIAALASDFTKDIPASDAAIEDFFRKNSFRFKVPLSLNLEYLSVAGDEKNEAATREKIRKAYLRLQQKEDFKNIAQELKTELRETGLYPEGIEIPQIGWSAQIANFISKVRPGQYLMPLLIDKNYYIIRLKQRKDPYIPDFKDIRERVRQTFIQDEAQNFAKEKIASCWKKLKETAKLDPKAADFKKMAKQFGLKISATGLFKYNDKLEGLGKADIFWKAAQELKDNDFSEVIAVPAGFYIVKVKSRIPLDEKKFAQEKEQFSRLFLEFKKQEAFSKFFEDLRSRSQKL